MTDKKTVSITRDELDELFELCDNITYRCGQDGWVPTKKELEDSVDPKYHELALMREKTNNSSPIIRRQKQILLFLLWISETSENLSPETDKYIQHFLKAGLNIVD